MFLLYLHLNEENFLMNFTYSFGTEYRKSTEGLSPAVESFSEFKYS